ncbi:MAG: ParB/RepB/Spo0J family partition protein [Bacilli bacterium]
MTKQLAEINTDLLDDLFKTEEERQEDKLEKIVLLPMNEIHEFKNHPFKVRMDSDMSKLVDSIKENGVLQPALVRVSPYDDGYEMVSGHRRMRASELNDLKELPVIIRNLTDEQATILMVDSNIQRENILPSERGLAYKMKLEAMKNQGKRVDLTCSQLGNKLKGKKSLDVLAEEVGESKNQVHRYIRLTELIEPLIELVDGTREDNKKIALNPAVELSYLSKENQELIAKYINEFDLTPSHAQTIRMKELSKEERLDDNVIYTIMTEEKPNQKEKITLKSEDINKYFEKNLTPRQKEQIIIKLLEARYRKIQREQER